MIFGLENGCSFRFDFGFVLEFWFENKSVILGLGFGLEATRKIPLIQPVKMGCLHIVFVCFACLHALLPALPLHALLLTCFYLFTCWLVITLLSRLMHA